MVGIKSSRCGISRSCQAVNTKQGTIPRWVSASLERSTSPFTLSLSKDAIVSRIRLLVSVMNSVD
jgi:hypothetical protein